MKHLVEHTLQDINEKIGVFREALKKELMTLPDEMPGFTRINRQCGILSFSAINNGKWSPKYCMTTNAKKTLLERCDHMDPGSFQKFVENTIKTGVINKFILHPVFVARLKALWEES